MVFTLLMPKSFLNLRLKIIYLKAIFILLGWTNQNLDTTSTKNFGFPAISYKQNLWT